MQFENRTGTASELREGDFVDTMGGPRHKRYRIQASVQSVTPNRTRVKLTFNRLGSFTALADYPVSYRRPVQEA